MSLTRRSSTPAIPIPQSTSRHDTNNTNQNYTESKTSLTYRDRIFEYHVVVPLLLKMIDESHPHEIPVSGLYRAIATYAIDSSGSAVSDYWTHLCDHDKAWFVQNFSVLLKDSNLSGRLVDDDSKYLNVMLDSTPELDQLVSHDDWMEMARHAAITRWDGSSRYDDLLKSYGLPMNALTMWQVSSFHPDDFDDAWSLLFDDWKLAARDKGLDTEIKDIPKPDWFYRLESKSREEDWFIRKTQAQEESTQEDQEDSEIITTGNDFLEDKSWDEINDESVGSYRSPLDDDYWSSNDYTVRSDFGDGGLSNDSSGSYEIQDDELDLNNKALNKTSWDKSSNMDDDRPSWDLGNGVIGADA